MLDRSGAVVTEDLIHLVEAELIVTGWNRRVRGEDALATNGFQIDLLRLAKRIASEMFFEEAYAKQCGMALVHVMNGGFTA
jgi:hypothetical protein